MIKLLVLFIGILLFFTVRSLLAQPSAGSPRITPTNAASRVKDGSAVLIDVREPTEWEAGVAAPAYLLPLSDLRGERTKWHHVLADAKDKTLIVYCRSGNRSGQAAAILAKEGFTVVNAGGFRDWQTAKLPIRQPDEPAGND